MIDFNETRLLHCRMCRSKDIEFLKDSVSRLYLIGCFKCKHLDSVHEPYVLILDGRRELLSRDKALEWFKAHRG